MRGPAEDNDTRRSRLWGTVFTVLYSATFVALFLWGTLNIEASEQAVSGMLVDFGKEQQGFGVDDTPLADPSPLPEPDRTPAAEEPVTTQQVEDAPVVEERNEVEKPKAEDAEQHPTEERVDDVEPAPREVDRRAMFPGNRPESQSDSQGAAEGAGNQGSENGTVSDNYEGAGGGDGFEPNWDLEGRHPRNDFPRPRYNASEHGLVVVEIWVDASGVVTYAAYSAKGSTVSTKSPLIEEAVKAARGVRFDESDQDIQKGTITYSFNLNTKARK